LQTVFSEKNSQDHQLRLSKIEYFALFYASPAWHNRAVSRKRLDLIADGEVNSRNLAKLTMTPTGGEIGRYYYCKGYKVSRARDCVNKNTKWARIVRFT
jgi:hypothetical protein